MKNKIREILESVNNFKTDSNEELESFRIKYLSKKGIIPALFGEFKNVAPEARKEVGKALNELKIRHRKSSA